MFRFRCKRCKNSFSFEEHPSYHELFRNIPTFDESKDVEVFTKWIEDVTANIECTKCKSSVYLIGIGDKLLDSEIDFTSTPIVILIKKAIELVNTGQYEKYKECASKIIWLLLDEPGQLIYFEDTELMNQAISALKIIWDDVDTSELFDEMVSSGNMVEIIGGYTDRAKLLMPTLIDKKIDDQTSAYFQEAIYSWLFGLNCASLILCCSIIENLLRQKLWNIDLNLVLKKNPKDGDLKDRDLFELINNAESAGIIDKGTKSKAHKIRIIRKEAVHRLRKINSDESFRAITDTKHIVEKILKGHNN